MYKKLLLTACILATASATKADPSQQTENRSLSETYPAWIGVPKDHNEFPPTTLHNINELNEATTKNNNLVVAIKSGFDHPGCDMVKYFKRTAAHHNDIEIPNAQHALIYQLYVMEEAKKSEKSWIKRLFGKTPFHELLKALKINLSHLCKHGYAYAFYKNGTCIRRYYGYLSDKELLAITAKLF